MELRALPPIAVAVLLGASAAFVETVQLDSLEGPLKQTFEAAGAEPTTP